MMHIKSSNILTLMPNIVISIMNRLVLVKDDAGAGDGTIFEFGQTPIPSRPGTK